MNARDQVFGRHVPKTTTRARTSAFVGSRITYQGEELDVVAIGPFPHELSGTAVRFRACRMGIGTLEVGSIIETRWGLCEIVG